MIRTSASLLGLAALAACGQSASAPGGSSVDNVPTKPEIEAAMKRSAPPGTFAPGFRNFVEDAKCKRLAPDAFNCDVALRNPDGEHARTPMLIARLNGEWRAIMPAPRDPVGYFRKGADGSPSRAEIEAAMKLMPAGSIPNEVNGFVQDAKCNKAAGESFLCRVLLIKDPSLGIQSPVLPLTFTKLGGAWRVVAGK
jgi:hypothetical protein